MWRGHLELATTHHQSEVSHLTIIESVSIKRGNSPLVDVGCLNATAASGGAFLCGTGRGHGGLCGCVAPVSACLTSTSVLWCKHPTQTSALTCLLLGGLQGGDSRSRSLTGTWDCSQMTTVAQGRASPAYCGSSPPLPLKSRLEV